MKCTICNKKLIIRETLNNHEIDVTRVYSEPNITNQVDIPFYYCEDCQHGQIEVKLPENFYDQYQLIHNPDDSGGQGSYTKSQILYYNRVLEELALYSDKSGCILDIGCGPGTILNEALKYFHKGIGVEPSKKQAEIGRDKYGLNILNSYFNKNLEFNNKITSMICTQVLEHISSLPEFVNTAYDILEVGGVGVFEVPNGQRFISEERYYDVFPEHVNYFSVKSLSTLFSNTGFQIIKICEAFQANYLLAFVRKTNKYNSFCDKIVKDKEKVEILLNKYEKIAIWGAGTKARSFIGFFKDSKKVSHIFDINPNIQNYYLCNSSLPIEMPEYKKINEVDLIIIFALQYKSEIIDELVNKYGYKGDILCMDEINT